MMVNIEGINEFNNKYLSFQGKVMKEDLMMEFNTDIFSQFDKKWALLTAGDMESFNTMTISWGGLCTSRIDQ